MVLRPCRGWACREATVPVVASTVAMAIARHLSCTTRLSLWSLSLLPSFLGRCTWGQVSTLGRYLAGVHSETESLDPDL
jgi:hypothetical protein